MTQERRERHGPTRLVLASASPRRCELLAGLGLSFTVRPAAVDETPRAGEDPAALVERLAREKAAAVALPGELVLAADTEVAIDGGALGKPADATDAARMLALLAGRRHEVVTGVALLDADRGRLAAGVERTQVLFAPLSPREIDWYVSSGEPMDRAGAYAIQGLGALLVRVVEGNYLNVVGLPLPLVYDLCRQLGVDLLSAVGAVDRLGGGRYVGTTAGKRGTR
ncbi:MAG TPA: Maf family protein [Thermoanaerobaculia bacterium]|jgi:septum formation protein|nr:Maf family protein [Thermoanaerobaculia bacterium]